jgi:hypothetical protein
MDGLQEQEVLKWTKYIFCWFFVFLNGKWFILLSRIFK